MFYYLYDGLMNKQLGREYHLDHDLRQQHAYLTADKRDAETTGASFSCTFLLRLGVNSLMRLTSFQISV